MKQEGEELLQKLLKERRVVEPIRQAKVCYSIRTLNRRIPLAKCRKVEIQVEDLLFLSPTEQMNALFFYMQMNNPPSLESLYISF